MIVQVVFKDVSTSTRAIDIISRSVPSMYVSRFRIVVKH